jgi:hypothetical protein
MPQQAGIQRNTTRMSIARQRLADDILGAARRGWGAGVLVALADGRRDVLRRACELLDADRSTSDDAREVVQRRLRSALGLSMR